MLCSTSKEFYPKAVPKFIFKAQFRRYASSVPNLIGFRFESRGGTLMKRYTMLVGKVELNP